MKKISKMIFSVVMIFLTTICLVACGNSGDQTKSDIKLDENGNIITPEKPVEVNFWGWGDKEEVEVFNRIVNQFNTKYEGKIKVNYIQRPSNSYAETLLIQLSGKNGPDVFYAQDKIIKQYATLGYCEDLSGYVKDSKFDTKLNEADLFSNILSRYRYDTVKTTSNPEDPLWAVPKDLAPTAIYYNKKHFENAGITIISKTEEEMKAANDPVKAYFYDNDGKYTDPIFKGWVFNNKIPMNWEECYLLSKDLMKANDDTKGFFSEWWFNYGWSVGGNCVQYIETTDAEYNSGRYKFTLNDSTKNYIVKEDVESVTVNGKVYRSGETIEFQDKVETANIFSSTATPGIRQEVIDLFNAGKLNELPSQREAFTEFVRLSHPTGKEVDDVNGVFSNVKDFYGSASDGKIFGYGIAPNPTAISSDGKTGYFTSGKVSMLVDTMSKVKQIRANMKDEWDVCPMLQYKEYSKDGTEVLVRGKQAAHSGSVGICVNSKSMVKLASYCFAEYIASSEGQRIQAEEGFAIPIQKSVAAEDFFINSGKSPANIQVFVDACEYEIAGDWWLLSDSKWIDDWANLLNGDVRNGDKNLSQFYVSDVYLDTQNKLDAYTKK